MDFSQFQWTREPAAFEIGGGALKITTRPHTDLWQRTYYHFRNDNAPVFQMETEEQYFSFTVRTDFSGSHHRFDQCGVVLYLDSDNWLKGSVEYENERFQHLGSVVTNEGWSDWATTEIGAGVKSMWYRLSRRADDYRIECSEDGVTFRQMRICHLHQGGGRIRFGVYACSPEDSSFTAVFDHFSLGECQWQAHDGQQPDGPADSPAQTGGVPMRRSDREVTDFNAMVSIMERCDVCRLALNGGGYPYILPLNFGMTAENGRVTLYFHGAMEGAKYALMERDSRASFEMDCDHALIMDDVKKTCTMAYQSVIGRGHIEPVPEEEKYDALRVLMAHYHREEFPFGREVMPRTKVFKLVVESMTGKIRPKK